MNEPGGRAATVAETGRLRLREASLEDGAFILELLSDPSWHRFIGDKGVRTVEDARSYVERVILSSYRQHGFGLLVVELRQEGVPMGLCGLIRREGLEDVDVGFALLPRFRGRGHAREPVEAVLDLARREHGLARLVAVTAPDNAASIAVLGGAGFRREGLVRLAPGGPELELHAIGPARGG